MSEFKDVEVNIYEAFEKITKLKADYAVKLLIINSLVAEKEASAQVIASLHDQITALTSSTNLVADDQVTLNEILALSLALKNIIDVNPVDNVDIIDNVDVLGQVV